MIPAKGERTRRSAQIICPLFRSVLSSVLPSLLPKMTTRNNCAPCIRQIVIERARAASASERGRKVHLEPPNRKIVEVLPPSKNYSATRDTVAACIFSGICLYSCPHDGSISMWLVNGPPLHIYRTPLKSENEVA